MPRPPYTPVINRIAGWQLYQGNGFSAAGEIPTGEWVRLKLEVSGDRARVFLGDSQEPTLEIHELKHGITSGGIGLLGPTDRTAYFSNFSYRLEESIPFAPPPVKDAPPGSIERSICSDTAMRFTCSSMGSFSFTE